MEPLVAILAGCQRSQFVTLLREQHFSGVIEVAKPVDAAKRTLVLARATESGEPKPLLPPLKIVADTRQARPRQPETRLSALELLFNLSVGIGPMRD